MKHFTLQEYAALQPRLARDGDLAEPMKRAYAAIALLTGQLGGHGDYLLALAMEKHPGVDEARAVSRLAEDIDSLAEEVIAAGRRTEKAVKSARAQMAPILTTCVHRTHALEREIRDVEALLLVGADDTVLEKQSKMRKSGVPEVIIKQLAPGIDREATLNRRDSLRNELAKIAKFLKTYDRKDLPQNFDQHVEALALATPQPEPARGAMA